MSARILKAFSKHRLGGEPVPDDLAILLPHATEVADRTGIGLNWQETWAPWLDTSYLSEAERSNPDIAAAVRASAEVCSLIAFVARHEDGECYGFWRGPKRRSISHSPLVYLDTEGSFRYSTGPTFAELLLGQTFGGREFADLRKWLKSLGISVRAKTADELTYPQDDFNPGTLDYFLNDFFNRVKVTGGAAAVARIDGPTGV